MIDVRKQLSLFLTILCSLMLVFGACGDDDKDNGNGGTTDTGTTDNGGTPDAGTCTINTGGVTYPSELSDGDSGTRPIQVIIEAVDFENDVVVIKNVTSDTLAFTENWRVYTQASDVTLAGINLDAGARLKIHLTSSGINDTDDYYPGRVTAWIEACSGEVAVLQNDETGTSWFNRPEIIEAFVMWGGRSPFSAAETFNNEAVAAGAWDIPYDGSTSNVQVCWSDGDQPVCTGTGPCEPTDWGILSTGSVTSPSGWTQVPEAEAGCLAP